MDAQHPLVSLPLDDPAYVQLDALDRMGCRAARVASARPFTVGAVRAALERGASEPRCTGRLLDALRARFRSAPGIGAPATPAVAPSGAGIPLPTLPAPESTAVAPDLLAYAVPDTTLWTEGLVAGGSLTIRATGLSGGEFRPYFQDVRPTSEGDPPAVVNVRGRLRWAERRDLVAVAEAYFQSSLRNDPLIRGKGFNRGSSSLDFSEAYATGRLGSLWASFGRSRDAWLGRGSESLGLSAQSPPTDRLLVGIDTRRVEARAIVAMLSDVYMTVQLDTLPVGTPPLRFRRMLYGHLLTLRPTSALELTLGETMHSSRRAREVDFVYLNPLMSLTVTQDDSARLTPTSGHDNLNVMGAARLRLGRATLGAELLVDEIQIDAADRALFPDELAWRVEASAPLPFAVPAALTAGYRHVNSYTYLRSRYTETYNHYDRPLGSELGPDADLFEVGAEVWPRGLVRVAASAGIWRHGAFRIDDRPGRDSNRGHLPFPSTSAERPAVQKAALGEVSVQFLGVASPITLRIQTARITNTNNQFAPAKTYARAQLIGTYAFRYP